jgi:hypothetical protein
MFPRTHRLATPGSNSGIVPSMLSFHFRPLRRSLASVSAFALASVLTLAQNAPAPQTNAPPPTESLRPVLVQISQTLANVNVSRWKAPGDVKNSTQQDMDSISRDLNTTLPPLLDQASASPGSVAATFAVYRNIDALYDVLLRVSQTAMLSGAQNDAVGLEGALQGLQSARKDLGNTLMDLTTAHDQELIRLRTAAAAAAQAPAKPATPAKVVVEDGPPQKPASARRKKATPPAHPAGSPPTPTPQ